MDIIQQLRDEEGEILHAYQDHLGYWTIGVGILIDKRKGGGLTREESAYILDRRVRELERRVFDALPWARSLNEARQAVLIGMAFQMGMDGLMGFHNTLRFIKEGKFKEAAGNMLVSKWASQTSGRAKRMAKQMETGEWVRK